MQKQLSHNWPGIFIPSLPEIILINNPNNKLITKRKNILNNFCSKISQFEYLINSNEFQSFLKDNYNICESNSNLDYNEILLRYKKNFNNINKSNDEIDVNKIQQSILYIKNNIDNLKEFQNNVLSVINEKENEIKNISYLINIFADYEKNILINYTNNDLLKLIIMNPENEEISKRIDNLNLYLINPFIKLLDWIENDILDYNSMLTALNQFKNLILNQKSTISKLNELNKKIKEMENNKNNINYLNILKNCSSSYDNQIDNLIKERDVLENNKNNIFEIINIIYMINEEFLKKFKKEKIEKYNEQFNIFIEEEKNNQNLIKDLWICISNITNMKNLPKENKEINI